MNDKIIEIDSILESIVKEIKNITTENDFELLCEFSIENFDEFIEKIELANYQGLYFFEIYNNYRFDSIEDWKEDFVLRWTDKQYLRKHVPNPRKSRLNRLNENKEWIPLYIGKSKKISSRIIEHINKELSKHTFAMKLKSRSNLYDEIFRVSVLKVDTQYYDLVVPLLEKEMRNKLHPIIGKQ